MIDFSKIDFRVTKYFKYLLIIVGSLTVAYILINTIWSFSPEINHLLNRQKFDSEQWISWTESEMEPALRWNMVNNLIKTEKLKGKTVEEIKELLGEPSSENKISLSYNLGMTGRGINSGSLQFEIKDGIIVNFSIWQG
jgi:hypothetical protein